MFSIARLANFKVSVVRPLMPGKVLYLASSHLPSHNCLVHPLSSTDPGSQVPLTQLANTAGSFYYFLLRLTLLSVCQFMTFEYASIYHYNCQ